MVKVIVLFKIVGGVIVVIWKMWCDKLVVVVGFGGYLLIFVMVVVILLCLLCMIYE